MLGAIAGDMIGSVFEGKHGWHAARTPHFEPLFGKYSRFTDDTVLTAAVAEWLLHGDDLIGLLKDYALAYPHAGYGGTFIRWAMSLSRSPYNSWGNGSAMRVSPVAWAFSTLDDVLTNARRSAEVTHNHPEGIKGAEATAAAVFLARTGATKEFIRDEIGRRFGYDLRHTVEEIWPGYGFDVSCQGSVPQAITAFLDAESFEHAVRLAVSLGGDTDTIGCITGSIAEAFYGGVPEAIRREVFDRLDRRITGVVEEFEERHRQG